MIGTTKKERTDENINNPPYTRLNARAQGRSMKIPTPAISPTIPVARIRKANAKRAMGISKAPNRNNSYIKTGTENKVQPIKNADAAEENVDDGCRGHPTRAVPFHARLLL
jgi:hypothetical protein